MQQNNEKENRTIEPKIYGLIIESHDSIFLSVQYAYNLEEAFVMAKLEFEQQNPTKIGLLNPLNGAKIGLFIIKTREELFTNPNLINKTLESQKNLMKTFDSLIKSADETIKKIVADKGKNFVENSKTIKELEDATAKLVPNDFPKTDKDRKNNLMRMIIEKKDKVSYDLVKSTFSDAERKYIETQINKKVNNKSLDK